MHLETEQAVEIDGHHLDLNQLVAVARFGARVRVSEEAIERMRRSRQAVEDIVKKGEPAYGINTGFGDFSKNSHQS